MAKVAAQWLTLELVVLRIYAPIAILQLARAFNHVGRVDVGETLVEQFGQETAEMNLVELFQLTVQIVDLIEFAFTNDKASVAIWTL